MRNLLGIKVGVIAMLATGGLAQAQLAPSVAPSSTDTSWSFFHPNLYDKGSPFIRFFREGEWYFSWGGNKETFARTDIHVSQPSLGNDFTIHGVQGHDEPDLSGLLKGDFFGPQYNIRIGRFINADRTIAVELSFDHTKYTATDGQTANVTGIIGNAPVNGPRVLDANFFRYLLHNGANHVMTNLVYRKPLLGELNETYSLAFIGKAGAGIMMPHVDNTILGNPNDVGSKTPSNFFGIHNGWWQFGGWTSGVEAGLRYVVWKPFYIELTDKVAYASLWNLNAFQGAVSHGLWMNEVIFSVGFTYDGASSAGKH